MSFGRKVKKTERAVKAHEYKIGSKAAAVTCKFLPPLN